MFSWSLALILVLSCGLEAKAQVASSPLVNITTGPVLGVILQSAIKGRNFYAYRGIPYAKPPLQNLRFTPPQPVDSWTATYDATTDKDVCPQSINGQTIGNEDCLYVYVYTPVSPRNATNAQLPVLVFFHIAGWLFNGPTYGNWKPERFMDYDAIVVVVGFRLGPLGFLSTNDTYSPGNYGLKDQNYALQWVQKNIGSFGGDPSKVTLMGSSAGSASVTFHQISPRSKGLFRAAIAQSGSSLCYWAIQHNPLKWAQILAKGVDCPTTSTEALVTCLRGKSVDQIIQESVNEQSYNYLVLPWVPVIEDPNSKQPFITDLPLTYYQRGKFAKVPTIVGVNRNEAYGLYTLNAQYFQSIDATFDGQYLPTIIKNITKYEPNLPHLVKDVKYEYYGNDVSNANIVIHDSIRFISDSFFKTGFDLTVRKLADQRVPTYYYAFNYVGSGSINNYIGGRYQITHGDELYYQWTNFSMGGWTANDQKISTTMLDYWINFATNLDPNTGISTSVTWNPVVPNEQLDYLMFYNKGVKMLTGYNTQQMYFWQRYVPNVVAFYPNN